MNRWKMFAVGLMACGVSIPVSSGSAAAATVFVGDLVITTTSERSTMVVSFELPMERYDAQGYINNGARIEVRCYGDDPVSDDWILTRTYTGTSSTGPSNEGRLYATDRGVELFASMAFARGGVLNEDTLPDNGDEIYCRGKWIDGDGATLTATTNTARGTF